MKITKEKAKKLLSSAAISQTEQQQAEIAEKLDISVRTVERQIYLSLVELKKIVFILFFLHFI